MATWYDWVTNRRYVCDASWDQHVREHLAGRLKEFLAALGERLPPSSVPRPERAGLAEQLQRFADAVARFWKWAYYPLVFPLAVSLPEDGRSEWRQAEVRLTRKDPMRGLPVQGGFPPILAWTGPPWDGRLKSEGQDSGASGDNPPSPCLAAEGALASAAIAAALVRPLLPPPDCDVEFHEIRLALLLMPLAQQLDMVLGRSPESREPVASQESVDWIVRVRQLMGWWGTDEDDQPDWLPREVQERLQWLRRFGQTSQTSEPPGPSSGELALVTVGAHQIKRFVLESSSLPDIRGGSTLLDTAPARLEEQVARLLGPEAVLRQEGSFFTCLLAAHPPPIQLEAPGDEDGCGPVTVTSLEQWVDLLCAHYQSQVPSARVFAACVATSPRELLTSYKNVADRLWQEELRTRTEGQAPVLERLPFEKPCQFCRVRPAEGRVHVPDEGQGADACGICARKVEVGRAERRRKTLAIYGWGQRLPMEPSPEPPELRRSSGAGHGSKRFQLAETLNDLIPPGVEHRLLASVFGDGNQFGQLGSKLPTLAHAVHWARRVAATVKGAACVAMQQALGPLEAEFFPMEVLAIGGDDFNLFAWAPVGLRFTQKFMELTDQEFAPAPGSGWSQGAEQGMQEHRGQPSFSVGVLVTHVRAPVLFTMEFAEHELLEWAKRARRLRMKRSRTAPGEADSSTSPGVGGTAALYVATSLDAVPSDLKSTLAQVFRKSRSHGSGPGLGERTSAPYYLTLGPLTAAELGWLMDLAERHPDAQGPLRSLVEAWVRREPEEALLYSLYQLSRSRRSERGSRRNPLAELAEDLAKADHLSPAAEPGEASGVWALSGLRLEGSRLAGLPPLVDEDEDRPGESGEDSGPWWVPVWDLLQLMRMSADFGNHRGRKGGEDS